MVARVRRLLGEPRIGHTGTLDPIATGVLPLVLGRATRLARFLSGGDKSYEAVVCLGVSTDTADAEGADVGPRYEGPMPGRDAIERALAPFRGTFLQQPPAFSAKKVAGRRSYRIARAAAADRRRTGATAPPDSGAALPAAVPVTATRVEIVTVEQDRLTLAVDCSAGFYVRALARDLGERLGIGAHLVALRRTRSAGCELADAIPLDAAEHDAARARQAVIPMGRMLLDFPARILTPDGVRRAVQGRDLGPAEFADATPPHSLDAWMRLMDGDGDLVAIARASAASGLLHPSVVLK